jgi:methionyl-tRNA formyltransferase
MRVAALGRTRMLLEAVRLLVGRGHTVPVVATCKPVPEHTVGEDDFSALATEIGAQFLRTETLNRDGVVQVLRSAECDVAISVSWVSKVGAGPIRCFPFGVLNVHGGDLPRYRGNAPFAWAILNGERHVGITVHLMEADDFDSGPIVSKAIVPVTPDTYIGSLYERLERDTPAMLVGAAEGLVNGTLTPSPQVGSVLRCYPRRPEDARIDWRRSAEDITRLVRASAEPFSGSYCEYRGQRLVIWRAREERWEVESMAVPGQVIERRSTTGSVVVAAGEGLVELQLISFGSNDRVAPRLVIGSSRDRLS